MRPQVDPGHYMSHSYDSKERFCSYWHQIHEIISLEPRHVLEIGVGSGFVSTYLRRRDIELTTLDLDRRLDPDVEGTVTDLPFIDAEFDVVACYEVLEHMNFDLFRRGLSELSRVSSENVVISLPDANKMLKIASPDSRFGHFSARISIPTMRKREHLFDGEHHWEIGKAGYPLTRIEMEMESAGLTVLKTFRMRENPYHRFFATRKSKR